MSSVAYHVNNLLAPVLFHVRNFIIFLLVVLFNLIFLYISRKLLLISQKTLLLLKLHLMHYSRLSLRGHLGQSVLVLVLLNVQPTQKEIFLSYYQLLESEFNFYRFRFKNLNLTILFFLDYIMLVLNQKLKTFIQLCHIL